MRRRLLAGAVATGLLVLACRGGDATPRPTPTLLPPALDPRLHLIGEGSVALDVPPNGRQTVEPLGLAQAFGAPPPCAQFVFLFRWRLHGQAEVRWESQLRGATVLVGSGNEGSASVGCMVIEAVNESDRRVTGDLRYFLAEAR